MMVPQVIIFWNAEPLLLVLRQDPAVAKLASEYLKVLSAGLPAYAYFECIKRWLQAQGASVLDEQRATELRVNLDQA